MRVDHQKKKMTGHIAWLLLLFMALAGCKGQAQTNKCYIDDPMEELEWLQDIVQRHKSLGVERKADIYEYTYHGEKLFLADMCVGCPDFVTVVYNCHGDVVCQYGGITGKNTCPDLEEEAISKVLIWSSWQKVEKH